MSASSNPAIIYLCVAIAALLVLLFLKSSHPSTGKPSIFSLLKLFTLFKQSKTQAPMPTVAQSILPKDPGLFPDIKFDNSKELNDLKSKHQTLKVLTATLVSHLKNGNKAPAGDLFPSPTQASLKEHLTALEQFLKDHKL